MAAVLTALVALILTVVPLPPTADIARPAFLVLTVLYWSVNAPRTGGMPSVSLRTAAGCLSGPVLGEHALALALVSYIAVREHRDPLEAHLPAVAIIVFVLLLQGRGV